MPFPSRALALVATGATVFAIAPPFASAAPVTPTQRVTVTDANAAAQQWAPLAYDCTTDEFDLTPAQAMVTGPKTPPLGAGSRQFDLSTAFGSVQTEIYRTTVLDGRTLASLQSLQYSTYVASTDDNPKQPAYLRLTVDTDPGQNDNERHSLFFFPANNGDVAQSTWQTWNVLDGTISVDGDSGPAGTSSVGAYAQAHPAARVVNNNAGAPTGGGLSIATGCGGAGTRLSKANTDRVVIAAAAEGEQDAFSRVYDFEKDNLTFAPMSTVTVNKSNETAQGFTRQGYLDADPDGGPAYLSNSSYVVGPATPPAGIGSLKFTNPDPNGVQQLRTSKLDGTKISDIQVLDFSTYVTGTADEQPGYLKLDVDLDHNGTFDGALFYYPANNGDVQRGAWQTWNAAAATAKWNFNGDDGPDNAKTLAAYEAANPGAVVIGRTDGVNGGGCGLPECGGLSFQVGGSDTNTGGAYYVDRIVLGTTSNSSTAVQSLFDLEPVRPAITVTGPAKVDETATARTYTVTLAEASDQPITVDVDAISGTATEGTDFTGLPQTLAFAPGETTKTYTVNVLADTVDEKDETYKVQLTNAAIGIIGDDAGSVTTTITDDDPAPALAISDVTVTEPDGTATKPARVTFTLDKASERTATVKWFTANASATAPSDYVAASGTLTFAPGQTSKTIAIAVRPDTVVERDENFRVGVTAPVNLRAVDGFGLVTIKNDDTARVGLLVRRAAGHKLQVTVATNERQSNQRVEIVSATGGRVVSVRRYTLNAGGSLPATVLPDVYKAGQKVTVYARVITPGGVFSTAPQTVTIT